MAPNLPGDPDLAPHLSSIFTPTVVTREGNLIL
jgi:hypothetical protein